MTRIRRLVYQYAEIILRFIRSEWRLRYQENEYSAATQSAYVSWSVDWHGMWNQSPHSSHSTAGSRSKTSRAQFPWGKSTCPGFSSTSAERDNNIKHKYVKTTDVSSKWCAAWNTVIQQTNNLSWCKVVRSNTWSCQQGMDLLTRVGWLCWGLTSQSTIFQSCRDGAIASWVINQYFRGVKCLAQGHNTAAVGLEPRTSRSGVRHSTTEPPRSPIDKGNNSQNKGKRQ